MSLQLSVEHDELSLIHDEHTTPTVKVNEVPQFHHKQAFNFLSDMMNYLSDMMNDHRQSV